MSSKVVKLKHLLNQHKCYNFCEIKKVLDVDDEQLVVLVSQLIENDITSFNDYLGFSDYKNLYKCLNYLVELITLNIGLENSKILFELKKIYNCLEETINRFEEKKCQGIFIPDGYALDKFKEDVNKIIDNYNLIKAMIINNDEQSVYQFLKHLIIDIKKFSYVEEIFEKFPHLINISEKNVWLIEELVDEYIKQVWLNDNNSNYYEIIYFKKVINYMMNNPKFKISSKQKKIFNNKLLLAIDHLKRVKISKKEKERKKFFFNELKNDIKNINLNDLDEYIENINYKYNIHGFFNEYNIEADYKLQKINDNYYSDLRDKHTITIDNNSAYCFEDAFSIETLRNGDYLVGVYITDASAYIKAGTHLDMEAYARGRTIHLPNKTIAMLPEELTNNMLSLGANSNKLVIAYLFRFSSNMDLVDYKITRAIINVNKNLTFSNVSNILEEGNDIQDYQTLQNMLKIFEKLNQQNSLKSLYHQLKQMRRWALDNNWYDDSLGSRMVQELMILVNHFMASTFLENNLPFIYRINQSRYNQEEIKRLKEKWNNNVKIEEIIKCIEKIYEPSIYSVNNIGHQGLNLAAYAHTTIPARNYVSLVNQRLIKKFIIDGYRMSDQYYYKLEERLRFIAEHINAKNELYEDYASEYRKILEKKPLKNYKNN